MGLTTGIDWCDSTWGVLRGCSPVSDGCKHCYAANMAHRFGNPGHPFVGLTKTSGQFNGNVQFFEKHLLDPLKWGPMPYSTDNELNITRPRRIFVDSMSDLFHENVTDKIRDRIFAVMALCPQHTFQVLTKRPERMLKYFTEKHRNPQGWPEENYDVQTCIRLSFGGLLGGRKLPNGRPDVVNFFKSGRADRYGEADARVFSQWPLPNVWLGVSVENQAAADERIPLLLQTPAAKRFVSCEPLLGMVDLGKLILPEPSFFSAQECSVDALSVRIDDRLGLNWVICGGESGPGARPMHPDWARMLRDQCQEAGVPFFFKSWGEWAPRHDLECNLPGIKGKLWYNIDPDTSMCRVGKKAAGSLLDGVEYKQFPEAR